jgi:hypothetical protein
MLSWSRLDRVLPSPNASVARSLLIVRFAYYTHRMIRSCGDKETEKLLQRRFSKKFAGIEKSARVRLELLDAAISLNDLRLPGLRLEALKGNRIDGERAGSGVAHSGEPHRRDRQGSA